MFLCWTVPFSNDAFDLTPEMRACTLKWLDALGKWSLIDAYLLILFMVAFRFHITEQVCSFLLTLHHLLLEQELDVAPKLSDVRRLHSAAPYTITIALEPLTDVRDVDATARPEFFRNQYRRRWQRSTWCCRIGGAQRHVFVALRLVVCLEEVHNVHR